MTSKRDWEAAVEQWIVERRKFETDVPSEDDLIAYAQGGLRGEAAERVCEYLIVHPELAQVLSEPFPLPDDHGTEDADLVSEHELQARWRALQKQLPPRRSTAAMTGAAMVASLALVVGGLASYSIITKLQRTIEELRQPTSPPEPSLLLPDTQRGPNAVPIPLSADVDGFLLMPVLINQPSYPRYRVEIVDADPAGKGTLWTTTEARRLRDDTFFIWVPRRFLTDTTYRVIVYGVRDDTPQQLATYTFQLKHAASAR